MLRGGLIGIWTQSLFGYSTLFVMLSFIVVVYSSRSVTFSQESSIFAQFIMNQLRGLLVLHIILNWCYMFDDIFIHRKC